MANHRDTHPSPVEGCYGCKINTLTVVKGDLSPETADTKRRDTQLALDRDAYKRMRQDGVQPPSVDGSASLEQRALDPVEIDFKIPIPKKDLAQVKEIVAEMKQGQATKDFAW